MKEAAGEANMTVITIVLIAIVLAVGTVIVTNLMRNTADRSEEAANGTYDQASCLQAGGTWNGTNCDL